MVIHTQTHLKNKNKKNKIIMLFKQIYHIQKGPFINYFKGGRAFTKCDRRIGEVARCDITFKAQKQLG